MAQPSTQPNAPTPARGRDETPQYKLETKAYIGERICEEGQVIYYRGKPAWYMKPVNDAARRMVKDHPPSTDDPIRDLAVVKPAGNPQAN